MIFFKFISCHLYFKLTGYKSDSHDPLLRFDNLLELLTEFSALLMITNLWKGTAQEQPNWGDAWASAGEG